jgi:tRNA nucleotidyltransferase (CCA-adding enzyme)
MSQIGENLKIYLVGGAVRDRIMGIEPGDRDWVVVGSSMKEMQHLGFKQVGRDFPVFLHPDTGEEYALARSERKTSRGYHGFEFDFSPGITLEQDLSRRDLTINAMAMDDSGNLVDPYGGSSDISARRIRHVSDAFREDPVRVLRVARFAARFYSRGFSLAPETEKLMRKMVDDGEVDALVPERVWQEIQASLKYGNSSRFLQVLRECGALARILPEIDVLFGIPQVEKFHPEIDTGIHTLMSIDAAEKITDDPMVIFSVMVHDLGKALTPKEDLPAHREHEIRGIAPIRQLCKRLGIPSRVSKFALKVCEYHLHCHRVFHLKPATVLKVLQAFDGFRKPELIEKFTLCCLADKRGRTGHEDDSDEQMELLKQYHRAAMTVNGGEIADYLSGNSGSGGVEGAAIKKEIRRQRLAAIAAVKKELSATTG